MGGPAGVVCRRSGEARHDRAAAVISAATFVPTKRICIRIAIASASRGVTKYPVSPWLTISAAPPALVATTGSPAAM